MKDPVQNDIMDGVDGDIEMTDLGQSRQLGRNDDHARLCGPTALHRCATKSRLQRALRGSSPKKSNKTLGLCFHVPYTGPTHLGSPLPSKV